MTYEESYMNCKSLEELQEEVNSDVLLAKMAGSGERLRIIKESAEKVAKIKGW